MHDTRNNLLIFGFAGLTLYAFYAWLFAADFTPDVLPSVEFHRYLSSGAGLVVGAAMVYFVYLQDKLNDDLAKVSGGQYFERDGLCFWPVVRVRRAKGKDDAEKNVAEVCLYYQSRYSGVCEAVIHMRPPSGSIYSHKGASDLHFAFRTQPGGYGVIHQPIAVAREIQGQSIALEFGAAVRWPGLRGDKLRSKQGRACGTFNVDWSLAHRLSRHELCGEIDLIDATRVTLGMPTDVVTDLKGAMFKQETISFWETTKDGHAAIA